MHAPTFKEGKFGSAMNMQKMGRLRVISPLWIGLISLLAYISERKRRRDRSYEKATYITS